MSYTYRIKSNDYIISSDQQRIVFSLLISTHEILNIQTESTILKFNRVLYFTYTYNTTLIYKYRLQWICIQH